MAVMAFTILFQVFHLTPGGIGVYEASMTAALQVQGTPGGEALTLAVLTHGLKFAYAFGVGGLLTPLAFGGLPTLGRLRGSRDDPKPASRFENIAARLWNVLNEGKPFTPVFVVGTLVLLGLPHLTDGGYWARQGLALAALAPLFVVFYRYAFPLRLRAGLWVLLAVCLAAFRFVDPVAMGLVLALYLGFTVVLWGSIYYHLRIGTPWTNGFRFWRLVLENPDPTSGNFLEQAPKLLILVLLSGFLVGHPGALSFAAVEGSPWALPSWPCSATSGGSPGLRRTRSRRPIFATRPPAYPGASSWSPSTAAALTASPRRIRPTSTASPPKDSSATTCAPSTPRAPSLPSPRC